MLCSPMIVQKDNFILFIHKLSEFFFSRGYCTFSTQTFMVTVPAGLRAVLALSHLVNGTHPKLVRSGWS